MLVLALILTIAGTWLLNHNGSLTTDIKMRIAGFGLNIVALFVFASLYGTARGIFVYLGVWAFIGMVMTLVLPLFNKQAS